MIIPGSSGQRSVMPDGIQTDSITENTNGNGVVMLYDQMDFLKNLFSSGKKIIFISFENPYVLTIFSEAKNYICTFSDVPESQNAALNFLLGMNKQHGILPISIPYTGFNLGYKWNSDN